ncbi:caspase family protein [Streptomyces sp. NPDC003393]
MSPLDPRGQENRALLVCVSEYDHTQPSEPDGVPGDLPAVKHNLNRLRHALQRGRVFDEREIILCRSPSLDDFTDELHTAAQEAEGLLLCYFAGHGAVPSAGNELFLQMRNARVVAGGQAVFPGADAFSSVLTVLAGSGARRIVVILDCCYAGNAARVWHDFAHRHRILLLMGVQANRLIDSGDGGGPTPFTAELVRLLGADEDLSALELFTRARQEMLRADRTTTLGDLWEPQFVAEPGTDVLLTARSTVPARARAGSGSGAGPGPAPGTGPVPVPDVVPALPSEANPGPGAVSGPVPGPRPGSTSGSVPPVTGPGPAAGPGSEPASPAGPAPAAHTGSGAAATAPTGSGPASAPDRGPGPASAPDPGSASGPGPAPSSGSRDPASPQSSEDRAPSAQSSVAPPGGERTGQVPGGASGGLRAVLRAGRRRVRAVVKWFGGRGRPAKGLLSAGLVLVLAGAGFAGYRLGGFGGDHSCAPPLELRLLTDPDLEPTVRAAADAFLTSKANTTGHDCRRAGITVYSAGASSAVTALRRQTDAWQEPRGEDTNPQRDIGPQPDVWIPASLTDVARVTTERTDRTFAELLPDTEPFVYSPVVLAVPQNIAGAALDERVGLPLSRLISDLKEQDRGAGVLRPDPEVTDSALLATIGLYGGGGADPRGAEQSVRPTGPPAPTAADLLCALPGDRAVDDRTAALVPEFLLRSGVGCARTTRVPRSAEYPVDVPALTPVFVRVRWEGGDRDEADREDAVRRFHQWLTGEDGLAAFGRAGFRSASDPGHPLLDAEHPGTGVLRDPSPLPGTAGQTAMDTALESYRSADGPGRVLYLLDSSGSMNTRWPGPSGGPGILKQSLGGLGGQDEYGIWAVHGTADGPRYETLLSFGPHRRGDAERAVDSRARVRDAEADPHAALLAALDDMARRGTDDERPQLIVFVTDDEDDNRLAGKNLDEVLRRAATAKVPVDMVSLVSGGCDKGRPDARIADASHGRCLDASDDLGTGLHDEVARVGTGED